MATTQSQITSAKMFWQYHQIELGRVVEADASTPTETPFVDHFLWIDDATVDWLLTPRAALISIGLVQPSNSD